MEKIEGTCIRTNGTGFQIAEREGWLNISKYADPVPKMPEKGQKIIISLNKSGYVSDIGVLESIDSQEQASSKTEPMNTVPAEHITPSKDIVVTRLACMNTATAILSSGGNTADPDEVVKLAGRLEFWATR